jgi:hypothetical protein
VARIFLCHASEDKAQVRDVYHRLRAIDGFEPWLDEEELLPGQDWTREIPLALKTSDFILIFLSRASVAKRSYVQREMKLALDAWQELPEGTIRTIPVRLNDCNVPDQFRHYHWANFFDPNGFDRIVRAIRAEIAKRSATQNTSLEPLLINSWHDTGPHPESDIEVRAVEETLESRAAAPIQTPSKPASPGNDKLFDAVRRREEAATPAVSGEDRSEGHRDTTSNARAITGLPRRQKRRLLLVGGVLLVCSSRCCISCSGGSPILLSINIANW